MNLLFGMLLGIVIGGLAAYVYLAVTGGLKK